MSIDLPKLWKERIEQIEKDISKAVKSKNWNTVNQLKIEKADLEKKLKR